MKNIEKILSKKGYPEMSCQAKMSYPLKILEGGNVLPQKISKMFCLI